MLVSQPPIWIGHGQIVLEQSFFFSLQDYYFYMASNAVASSGFNVEMESYQRTYLSSERFLPDTIYLDRGQTFSFSVYLACGMAEHLAVEDEHLGQCRGGEGALELGGTR